MVPDSLESKKMENLIPFAFVASVVLLIVSLLLL
jgi:hypothetical protein